jgi:hypothetical protein
VECKLSDILGNIAVALLRSNESGNPFLGVAAGSVWDPNHHQIHSLCVIVQLEIHNILIMTLTTEDA